MSKNINKELMFLTANQIMKEKSNEIKGFELLYDARKDFYDKVNVSVKSKTMKAYGVVDRVALVKIIKVLSSYSDEVTFDFLKERFLVMANNILMRLVMEYEKEGKQFAVKTKYISEGRYIVRYFDEILKSEKGEVKEFADYNNVPEVELLRADFSELYKDLVDSSRVSEEIISKEERNSCFMAKYTKGGFVREILGILLSDVFCEDIDAALCRNITPVENDMELDYGLKPNIERKKTENILRNKVANHVTKNSLEVAFIPKAENFPKSVMSDILTTFKEKQEEIFKKENIFEAAFAVEFSKELTAQSMLRGIHYHFFTNTIKKMKLNESVKNRILNAGFVKLEYYEYDTDDDFLLRNKDARFLLINAVVTELFDVVLSAHEDEIYAQLSKMEKLSEKSEKGKGKKKNENYSESFDAKLLKKDKEIEELKEQIEKLSSMKNENKVLKKKLRSLEYEKNRSDLSEKEEKRVASEEIKEEHPREIIEEAVEEKELSDDEFRQLIRGKKILVWGIRESDAKQLESYREIKCFVTKKGSRNVERSQLDAYDAVVICTSHSNHSMYWKIREMVKLADKPYIHMRKTDTHISKYKAAISNVVQRIGE